MFVRSFVRIFLRDRPFNFSEILHEVVTSVRLESDILRFLKKNLVSPPVGQKGSKMPQNAPKQPKMTFFGPQLLIHPLYFSETWSKCEENCSKYKMNNGYPEKNLVRVPRGLLRLKNTPFWGLFFLFV